MKLVSVRENASPPKEATGDEAGSKLYEDKETKKLHGKATVEFEYIFFFFFLLLLCYNFD